MPSRGARVVEARTYSQPLRASWPSWIRRELAVSARSSPRSGRTNRRVGEVAAGFEAGPALEDVAAGAVAGTQFRPAHRGDVQREERQAEAGDVLPGVPLLVRRAAPGDWSSHPGRGG